MTMDKDTFDQNVKALRPRLLKTAMRITRDFDIAEEAVQEGLIKAWRNLDSFEERAQFYTWVTRIVINKCLTLYRKKKSRGGLITDSLDEENDFGEKRSDNLPAKTEDVLSALINAENRALAAQAFEKLSPERQRLLALRIKELSFKEIAEVMGTSPGSAKSMTFRARDDLAGHFADLRDGRPRKPKIIQDARASHNDMTRALKKSKLEEPKQGNPAPVSIEKREVIIFPVLPVSKHEQPLPGVTPLPAAIPA